MYVGMHVYICMYIYIYTHLHNFIAEMQGAKYLAHFQRLGMSY